MPVTLFPYQQTAADIAVRDMRLRPCLVVPPGGGKTVIALEITRQILEDGLNIDIITHREEIADQFYRLFSSELPGIIGRNHEQRTLVSVCGVDTIAARLETWQPADLAIVDEFHHAASPSWEAVCKKYRYLIGMTATPRRLDGIGLKAVCGKLIHGPSFRELIAAGRLVPAEIISTSIPDYSGVSVKGGDFSSRQIVTRVDKPEIIGNAIEHYERYAPGTKAVVFCCNIAHAKHIRDSFRDVGHNAEIITGNHAKTHRAEIIQRFRDGALKILVSVDVVSEGFDLPDIETAILLRPTMSETLFIQQTARSLRASPGKSFAVIIDAVGNIHRHGFPWEDRDYTLEGRKPTVKDISQTCEKIARCEVCFHVYEAFRDKCPFCGAGHEKKQRVIKEKSGELTVLSDTEYRSMIQAARERAERAEREKREEAEKQETIKNLIRQARTLNDFQLIANFAGYNRGWAWHRWRSRR